MANEFEQVMRAEGREGLRAQSVDTIQVNVGLVCDLSCSHCHVGASPRRTESMSWETMEHVIRAARAARAHTVDITGGAPELNPDFRRFVSSLREQSVEEIIVRSNLTVFHQPGQEETPGFFREHRVRVVASLPCYLNENVDAQRGDGVFDRSISSLQRLNELGYGRGDGLRLDLVYNPQGPSLPPEQRALEIAYTEVLRDQYGIEFDHLLTITNMPIGRFWGTLKKRGEHDRYAELLRSSHNPSTVAGLMCRGQVSVRWDGALFDCDFNLALRLGVERGVTGHIKDFDPETFARRRISTGNHCFACTAGCGSSCGGALAAD